MYGTVPAQLLINAPSELNPTGPLWPPSMPVLTSGRSPWISWDDSGCIDRQHGS